MVLAEYAPGIVAPLALGLWSLRVGLSQRPGPSMWQVAFGAWLVTIAANYVPLFLYAGAIARAGSVQEEDRPELARARRYGVQQAIILVPLLVVIVTVAQERGRRRRAGTRGQPGPPVPN